MTVTRICCVVFIATQKEMTSVMDIRINVLDGDPFSLSIASDASVGQLKAAIHGRTGIDEDQQILLYLGHILEQEKRLSDYDIHSGVCIQLVKHQVSSLYISISLVDTSGTTAPRRTGRIRSHVPNILRCLPALSCYRNSPHPSVCKSLRTR